VIRRPLSLPLTVWERDIRLLLQQPGTAFHYHKYLMIAVEVAFTLNLHIKEEKCISVPCAFV